MLKRVEAFKRVQQYENAKKCCKEFFKKYPDNFDARFELFIMDLEIPLPFNKNSVIEEIFEYFKRTKEEYQIFYQKIIPMNQNQ